MGERRLPSTGMLLVRIIFIPLTYLQSQYGNMRNFSEVYEIRVPSFQWMSYSDWSPTLSRLPHGTRVIPAISLSNLVSRPRTKVTNAFVITAENSSCTVPWIMKWDWVNHDMLDILWNNHITCTSDISTPSANWESIILDTLSARSPDCKSRHTQLLIIHIYIPLPYSNHPACHWSILNKLER